MLICITFTYDSMYISYSIHVIVQLRLLKYKLKHLVIGDDIGKLYDCLRHHQFLLSNADLIDLISTSTYIVALLIQFGYWSVPVEEIVFELSTISTAVYTSKWYEEDTIVKRILLTMMVRAQTQKYMSAGGLMEMNINTFGSVVRKIFSFYALIKNVLD
ncbi:hypothetical protein Trydic_g17471 [Trypoxylus dichotomus]